MYLSYMILKLILIFILYSENCLQSDGSKNYDLVEFKGVMTSLNKYFLPNCIYLIQSGDATNRENENSLESLQKELSNEQIRSAIIDSIIIGNLSKFNTECSTSMFILTCIGAKTQALLRRVSMEPWFSSGKWLLYTEIKDLEHFFLGIDVPFNSEMLVVLRTKYGVELKELYRVRSILPLQICHFGSWNKSCGFEGPDLEFRDRRNNLHGLAMKTVSVHFPPLSTMKGKYEFGGFVGETWHVLEQVLNFTSEFITLPDMSWGVRLSNGSWTGLVGAVQRNQVDVVAALLTLASQRSEIADFSITWSDLNYLTIIKRSSERDIHWSMFLSPFEYRLWWCLLLCVTLTAVLLAVHHPNSSHPPGDTSLGQALLGGYFTAFGAMVCLQSQCIHPSFSRRLLILLAHLTGLVLLAAYSGKLVSIRTSNDFKLPFINLKGLYDNGNYEVGILKKTTIHQYFYTAKSGLLKEIYDSHMDHDANNHPGNLIEGLSKVCAMEHYAYLTTYELSFPLLNKLDCRLVCLPEIFSKVRHSILLTKHSPYRKAINNVIQKLKESGVLKNIKIKTMGIAVAEPDLKEDTISGVELRNVYYVFQILISGAIVSVIILAAEKIYHLLEQKYVMNRHPLKTNYLR